MNQNGQRRPRKQLHRVPHAGHSNGIAGHSAANRCQHTARNLRGPPWTHDRPPASPGGSAKTPNKSPEAPTGPREAPRKPQASLPGT
eukprot:4875829-Pyramimonas_sp.AAC.1